jgi:acyl-CoA thioester hydrolase
MTGNSKTTVADTNRQSYRHWTSVNIRYGDTDRQGHLNNAVYCTFFESGRCSFLFNDQGDSIAGEGKNFVIVKLTLDYLVEINFPGVVEIGSRIIKIGNSSFTVAQGLFKDGICCSTAESIIVQLDADTKKSSPITGPLMAVLKKLAD